MKIAIMQPYFFPYIGYISLIKHTDMFILFDTVQFIRHGWIERNRILKENEGWIYIKVPLIKSNGQLTIIKDVKINNTDDWKNKILAQLQHYKKKAPFFYNVISLLNEIFNSDYNDIVTLNKVSLEKISKYLGIDAKIEIFSKMNLNIEKSNAPDEWALNITKTIGADEYWNPPGGQSFFDKTKYDRENINLKFQLIKLLEYNQKRLKFEAGLSIIDVLMFNSVKEVNLMLDNYILL